MQSQLNCAMTEQAAARVLGLSVATLRAWRLKHKGPRFVRFGRAVRYLEDDIARYMEACAVSATSRAAPRFGGR